MGALSDLDSYFISEGSAIDRKRRSRDLGCSEFSSRNLRTPNLADDPAELCVEEIRRDSECCQIASQHAADLRLVVDQSFCDLEVAQSGCSKAVEILGL